MPRITILFLPGTGLRELFYQPLLSILKNYGHVERWAYVHHESMAEACRRCGADTDLYRELRSEVCFGPARNKESMLGIKPGQGITTWHEQNACEEYSIHWKNTIVVGHSQGAGHALMLSQHRELAGALMIAGPADTVQGRLSEWTKAEYKTPATRRLMLIHAKDAGFKATVGHAEACGLVVINREDAEQGYAGGKAVVETEPVPPLSAHGCLAGGQTWSRESTRFKTYHSIVDECLKRWTIGKDYD